MRRAVILLAVAALGLAGCGKKSTLRPADNAALPPKPKLAAKQPTVPDLLTASPQARPDRSDELVKKSQALQPDRFDLPPPG